VILSITLCNGSSVLKFLSILLHFLL
jgi:hypothetical protein